MLLRFSRLLVASGLFAAVTVSSVAGHLAPASATTLPLLRVGSATVIEGDTGQAVVNVPVDLSTPSSAKVTVSYAITGDTATAGSDFLARTGKVTFAAGKANKQISVRINGDVVKEADEHVAVTLSNAVNATIDVADGGVTIQDDDTDTQTGIQVNIGNLSVVEADGGTHIAELPVTLSRPAPSKLKIYYEIDCSTAVANQDYTGKQHGSISFNTGQQSKVLKFTVLADQTPEIVKSILDTIKVTAGSAVVHQANGEAQIIDDDGGAPVDPGGLAVDEVGRMSVASDGSEADAPPTGLCGGDGGIGSSESVTSADGRYVAFVSGAPNLVPGDHDGSIDAFVHDRVTGITERVSLKSDGSEATANPFGAPYAGADHPAISADGRYVTFYDYQVLVAGVQWPGGAVYLHDRVTGTTELISKNADGTPDMLAGNEKSPVSADGRYVAFSSGGSGVVTTGDADNPANEHNNLGGEDVFVRDRTTGTNTLVSSAYDGSGADGEAASMSDDGRYVAFQSQVGAIVPDDTNGCPDFYVRDMVAGTSQRVNLTNAGDQELPSLRIDDPTQTTCGFFGDAAISGDGTAVVWRSSAWNTFGLTAPEVMWSHLYLRNLTTGTTQRIDDQPAWSAGHMLWNPGLSDDGTLVSYICDCDDGPTSIWLYDATTGDRTETGDAADGTLADDANHVSGPGALSGDGHYLVFDSWASNLLPGDGDSNDIADVYIKRLS